MGAFWPGAGKIGEGGLLPRVATAGLFTVPSLRVGVGRAGAFCGTGAAGCGCCCACGTVGILGAGVTGVIGVVVAAGGPGWIMILVEVGIERSTLKLFSVPV